MNNDRLSASTFWKFTASKFRTKSA